MKKRVLKALITGLTMGILLTGCGSQFPEMTEEEYNQTVQYAVSVLMKYSNNGVERLSSLSSLELERQLDKEAREARKAERDAKTAEQVALMEQSQQAQAEGTENSENSDEINTDSSDIGDLAEANIEEENADDAAEGDSTTLEDDNSTLTEDTGSQNIDENDDIEGLLEKFGDELDQGIENAGGFESSVEDDISDTTTQNEMPQQTTEPTTSENEPDELAVTPDKTVEGMRQELSKGMFLTYSGYSVAGSYPDNDDIFVINATSGKKLLILNFRLANTSGTDVSVDMVKANPHFQVILNGKNVGYTNVTMLDNDLSSFKGMIPSGAKKSMVLIKQMDSAKLKNVESLGLIGDMGGDTIEFKLE